MSMKCTKKETNTFVTVIYFTLSTRHRINLRRRSLSKDDQNLLVRHWRFLLHCRRCCFYWLHAHHAPSSSKTGTKDHCPMSLWEMLRVSISWTNLKNENIPPLFVLKEKYSLCNQHTSVGDLFLKKQTGFSHNQHIKFKSYSQVLPSAHMMLHGATAAFLPETLTMLDNWHRCAAFHSRLFSSYLLICIPLSEDSHRETPV